MVSRDLRFPLTFSFILAMFLVNIHFQPKNRSLFPIQVNHIQIELEKQVLLSMNVEFKPKKDCIHEVDNIKRMYSFLDNQTRKSNWNPTSILILGSGGLIGSALVKYLDNANFSVLQVKNRYDIDLRHDGSLEQLLDKNHVQFCFFLACESDASKFTYSNEVHAFTSVFRNTMQQNVISSLKSRKIPFFFASSQMVMRNNNRTFSIIKRNGELLTLEAGGKVIRLENVYGPEAINSKTNIISNLIFRCLENRRAHIDLDESEPIGFVDVDNLIMTLIDMMQNFPSLHPITDLVPTVPDTMREISNYISGLIWGGCSISFSNKTERSPKQRILINPLTITGTTRCGIEKLVNYYTNQKEKKKSSDIYISFITACTNDDYNGIRSRLFTFFHFLGEQLRELSLSYEVILVQYNPQVTADYHNGEYNKDIAHSTDLPISQLIPLTSGSVSIANLRIITVPFEYHHHSSQGRFWEYTAKNVGARAAQGKFLLFTNVDNLFPTTLISWLAKEQLSEKRWYRTGWLNGEYTSQESCDKSATGHGACHKKGLCLQSSLGKESQDYCDVCLGDFSIFHRDLFFDLGGYSEIAQNLHVETAHMIYLEGLERFKSVISVWMDETLCHRDHLRNDRPAAPHDFYVIANLMKERPLNDSWGLKDIDLPEAKLTRKVVWDWGFNPETPYLLWPHHWLFKNVFFQIQIASSPFDRRYHMDFLGTKTKYEVLCNDWINHRRQYMSSRFVCNRMDVFARYDLDVKFPHIFIYGDIPIIDQEYFKWQTLLNAIKHWRIYANSSFVIAELGSRYGAWAARGAIIANQINPALGARLCIIEINFTFFSWIKEHMNINRLSKNASLIRGVWSNTKDIKLLQNKTNWQPSSEIVTIQDLARLYHKIDIMYINMQELKDVLCDQELHQHLLKHVQFIYIEFKFMEIWDKTKNCFLKNPLWNLIFEFQGNGVTYETEWGPIKFISGYHLSIKNSMLV